jgi:hypothetical protein
MKKKILISIALGLVAYTVLMSIACSQNACSDNAIGALFSVFGFVGACFAFFVILPRLIGAVIKGTPESPAISGELSYRQRSMMDAIVKQKENDPLASIKIGSKELASQLLREINKDKKVHVESLLAALGSLAGYSCHEACRTEFIVSGKHQENEIFTIVGGNDGMQYYFGDLPNKPLAEGQMSIWALIVGIVEHLGEKNVPDVKTIFSHVSKTVGGSEFGVPNVPEQHKPNDLPLNYVKLLWKPLLPILDKYCDTPMDRPILLGLAIQQSIEMSKDVIPLSLAAKLIMECAIPMSKIGPEWLT